MSASPKKRYPQSPLPAFTIRMILLVHFTNGKGGLVAIRTTLTEAFGLEYPIVLAPMASVSGGRLSAAVSNAGGLGLVGGGYGDSGWLRKELSLAQAETSRPWGGRADHLGCHA